MAGRNEKTGDQTPEKRDDPYTANPITKDKLAGWHAALAGASGQLSGAIARGSVTPRLLNVLCSMVRPALRDMERYEVELEVREQIAAGTKQARRVTSKRAR